MRRTVSLLLAAAFVAPATAAHACDIIQLETLVTELPPAPSVLKAGTASPLPVRITRAGQAAPDVEVLALLSGKDFDVYVRGLTGADGRVRLTVKVPPGARGPATLDVEAYRTLVDLPCAQVEEYDRNEHRWGRVR